MLEAELRRGEPGVVGEVGTAHRRQIEGEAHAADQAHGADEGLALRAGEERVVGGAEDRSLGPQVDVGEVDVDPLVDRHHHRRHGHVDVLPLAGDVAVVQGGEDGDGGVQT